jgi:2-amino-4-hydroxy-6-hydroxymethyldihydropteridine diphosphokinase
MSEQEMTVTAYIGLGSNIGDERSNLAKALELLQAVPGVALVKTASYYRSAPLGRTDQDWYLNTVAEVKTSLEPQQLLEALLDIEIRLGRVRTVRWGPRIIDLDLLLWDGVRISSPELILPHPRMTERAFVMVPLAELAPDLVLEGKTAAALAKKLASEQLIERESTS